MPTWISQRLVRGQRQGKAGNKLRSGRGPQSPDGDASDKGCHRRRGQDRQQHAPPARAGRNLYRRIRYNRGGCRQDVLDLDAGVGDVVQAAVSVFLEAAAQQGSDRGGGFGGQGGPVWVVVEDGGDGVGDGVRAARVSKRGSAGVATPRLRSGLGFKTPGRSSLDSARDKRSRFRWRLGKTRWPVSSS